MKGGFAYITTTTSDLHAMLYSHNIVLVDSTEGCSKDRGLNDKSKLSGIVLLAVIHLNKYRKRYGQCWERKHFDIVSSCKDNIIIPSNSHYQSSGYYFSWGNRANYKTEDKSSITQYTFKKGNSIHSELHASFIEELMITELKASLSKINDYLPFLSTVISLVLKVAFNMQVKHGDIKIEQTSASEEGIWQSTLSVNAITEELHTEDDVTYTVIDVPIQTKSKIGTKYHFLFQLNNKYNLSIPMATGTTIIFSGKLLSHRQSCNVYKPTDHDLFFNFGAYGNKKLYNHIKKSFVRMKESNN